MKNLKEFVTQLNEDFTSREKAHAQIENPNSSGQGFHRGHSNHPYHDTLTKHGFEYSHSTPVGTPNSGFFIHHTYFNRNTGRHVGVQPTRYSHHSWSSTKSTASGRHIIGYSADALDKHLKHSNRKR